MRRDIYSLGRDPQHTATITRWRPLLQSIGIAGSRNTGSTYYRLTGQFQIYTPMMLTAIIWHIRTAGDYTFDFLSTGAGSTSIFRVATNVALGTDSQTQVNLPTPVLLLPAKDYFLSAVKSAKVGWKDPGGAYYAGWGVGLVIWASCWYDGGANAYGAPIRLIGYPLEILKYPGAPKAL